MFMFLFMFMLVLLLILILLWVLMLMSMLSKAVPARCGSLSLNASLVDEETLARASFRRLLKVLHPLQRQFFRPLRLCQSCPFVSAFVKSQPFSTQTSAFSAGWDIGWRGSAGPALPRRRGRELAMRIRLTCTRVFVHVCVQGCACICAISLSCGRCQELTHSSKKSRTRGARR